jgi:hypothetical protein
MPDTERASAVALDAAGTVLGAVASGAAVVDHAIWSSRRWWARWLP